MSVGETSGPIHPVPTRLSGFLYIFTDKHHRPAQADRVRDAGHAQWDPSMSHVEEFDVFDLADHHEVFDGRGWLYGVRPRDDAGDIPPLGTWGQEIAEFPSARPGQPWHGYPLWPLSGEGPENRRGEKARPEKAVFARMEAVGLLTRRERKRLQKGDHL